MTRFSLYLYLTTLLPSLDKIKLLQWITSTGQRQLSVLRTLNLQGYPLTNWTRNRFHKCKDAPRVRHKWIRNERNKVIFPSNSSSTLWFCCHTVKLLICNRLISRYPTQSEKPWYLPGPIIWSTLFNLCATPSLTSQVYLRIHPGSICAESFVNRSEEGGLYLRLDA